MKPPLSFAAFVALAVLTISLAITGLGQAEILQLRVDPVAPVAGESVTFEVAGEQPTPCYARVISEQRTGVEETLITLSFELEPTVPGHSCPQVITAYTVQFPFEDGFAAGTYDVRVHERTMITDETFIDHVLEFLLEVKASGSGVSGAVRSWGAVKALFDPRP